MRQIAIAVVALIAGTGAALADGDAVLGQQAYSERCATCHAVGDDPEKNGPTLNNLIGRHAAAIEGFNYSPAMLEAAQAGVIWDIETLTKFIAKPRSVVNGSSMAFTGYRDPADVANVIAYLATFSPPPAQ